MMTPVSGPGLVNSIIAIGSFNISVFAQMHLDAPLQTGRTSAPQNAQQFLANARLASQRVAVTMRRVYRALGLGGTIGA
jgi:hypothetical protein